MADRLVKAVKGVSKKGINTLCDTAFANISLSIKKEKRFAYPEFGTFTVGNRK